MAAPGIGPGALWAGLANLPIEVKNYQQQQEERTRRLKREDVQTSRQDQAWADYQSEQAAKQAAASADFDYTVGPKSPVKDLWAESQKWGGPQAAPAAAQPAVANPNPAAGPAVTIGAPGAPGPGPQAAPAQTQATPQAAPMPPEWEALDKEYDQKIQTPMRRAWESLKAQGKDTPAAKAALMEVYRQRNQDFETRFQNLAKKTQDEAISRSANSFVDAVESHDDKMIKGMYGPNAVWGRDPRTNLDAVKIALPGGGSAYVGQDVVIARALLKAGMIQPKDYSKAASDAAKDQMELMKEQQKQAFELDKEKMIQAGENRRAALAHSDASNKEIEAAEYAGKIAYDQAKAAGKSEAEAKQAALEGKAARINVPVTRATAYVDFTHDTALARLDKNGQDEVNKAITQASGNILTGTSAITPPQAVARMMEFVKKDPTGGRAIAYLTGLNPEQADACKKKLDDLAKSKANDTADAGREAQKAQSPAPTVQRGGKTYYYWPSDNNYHTKQPPVQG